jgi:signal peptide peptidase SppA
MHFPHVVGMFFDNTWAMMPEAMPKMVQAVNRWAIGQKLDKETVAEIVAGRPKKLEAVEGNVAVLPLFGVVAQRMNIMQEISEGGTSTEVFGMAFDRAMSDPSVDAIVMTIDSPGGSVYGVEELADKIYKARGTKRIYAVANSLAASAAYWIGSAAEQFFVTPSGEAGSIGVLTMHTDWSKYNEKVGISPQYIYAGKYKVEGHGEAPLDPEARAAIQASVDSYYDSFTDAVARHRGAKQRDVKNGYGEGRVLRAKAAAEAGMTDGVKTYEQLIGELVRGNSKPRRSASGFAEKRELLKKHGE